MSFLPPRAAFFICSRVAPTTYFLHSRWYVWLPLVPSAQTKQTPSLLLGLELEEEGAPNICVSASSVSCPVPTVCGVQRALVAMAGVSPPFFITTLFPKSSKKTLKGLKETLSPNSKFLKFTMIGFAIPCGRGLFPLEETQWLTLATYSLSLSLSFFLSFGLWGALSLSRIDVSSLEVLA